jgi:iron(III) transport system substrate-binding protein
MSATSRKVVSGTTFAAVAALLAVAAQAQGWPAIATYEGADRQQKLEDGAKKEGALLFYTTTPVEYVKQLVEPFEKRHGIKVEVWRARSEAILQRTLNEARGGKAIVDVIHSISPPMEALRREGLLQEIHSPHHRELHATAAPGHRQWASTLQFVFVQAYNTQKVAKDELPRSYQDLLSPRWKGRLAIESSDHEWVTSVIKDLGEAHGTRLFSDLVRGNGLSARTGHPLLTNLTASGEVPLALTVYQYSVEQAKKKGSPIDWFVIEPAVTIADGIAVAKKAPHPHAALLFYDYMLSPEAQRIIARIGYVPTSTQAESPLRNVKLKVLDAGTLLDEQEKSMARFEAILQAR